MAATNPLLINASNPAQANPVTGGRSASSSSQFANNGVGNGASNNGRNGSTEPVNQASGSDKHQAFNGDSALKESAGIANSDRSEDSKQGGMLHEKTAFREQLELELSGTRASLSGSETANFLNVAAKGQGVAAVFAASSSNNTDLSLQAGLQALQDAPISTSDGGSNTPLFVSQTQIGGHTLSNNSFVNSELVSDTSGLDISDLNGIVGSALTTNSNQPQQILSSSMPLAAGGVATQPLAAAHGMSGSNLSSASSTLFGPSSQNTVQGSVQNSGIQVVPSMTNLKLEGSLDTDDQSKLKILPTVSAASASVSSGVVSSEQSTSVLQEPSLATAQKSSLNSLNTGIVSSSNGHDSLQSAIKTEASKVDASLTILPETDGVKVSNTSSNVLNEVNPLTNPLSQTQQSSVSRSFTNASPISSEASNTLLNTDKLTAGEASKAPLMSAQAEVNALGQSVLKSGDASGGSAGLNTSSMLGTASQTNNLNSQTPTANLTQNTKTDFSDLLNSLDAGVNEVTDETAEEGIRPTLNRITTTTTGLANISYRLVDGQPVATSFVPTTFGQPGWSEQVAGQVAWFSSKNIREAEIQLDPPELGSLQVRVSVAQEQASVSFTSPNASVREALDQSVARLREMFNEQDIDLVDVDVSGHSHDDAHTQESETNQDGETQLASGENPDTAETLASADHVTNVNVQVQEGLVREVV